MLLPTIVGINISKVPGWVLRIQIQLIQTNVRWGAGGWGAATGTGG